MAERGDRRIPGLTMAFAMAILLLPAATPEEVLPNRPQEIARGLLRFDPVAAPPATAEWLVDEDSTQRFIVQFEGPVASDARTRLEASALTVHDYLPHDSFLATVDEEGRVEMGSWPDVRAIIPYHPAFKVSPRLPTEGLVDATLLLYHDVSLADGLHRLEQAGATVKAYTTTALEHVVDATFASDALLTIANLEEVAWIEPSLNEGGLDNDVASAMTQSGTALAWPIHEHGVDGRSQIVSICDTGIATETLGVTSSVASAALARTTHEVFEDGSKYFEYNRHLSPSPLPLDVHRKIELYYSPQENGNWGDATDEHGHGTATAATLAGDRLPYGGRTGNDGVAPAARLAVCDTHAEPQFFILNDYANYWDPAYAVGARISSNSWGDTPTNDYTIPARQHDAYVWDHRDFLIVRSMGNAGPEGLMRPEAAAKSVVAVGAALNDGVSETLSTTTSQGPAADGRIKPNVVAPGNCLMTAALPGPDTYACASGTSLSTPVVAGAAALVRDYFERGFHEGGPRSPSAALVRAVLQLSGREIADDGETAGFPNAAQGWGRVTLEDVLVFDEGQKGLVVVDESHPLQTGDVFRLPIRVEADMPVRVQLAWSDAPAAAGANPAIVNDLDLRLVGPGARVHLGNSAAVPGQASPDRINVEEGIVIERPTPGDYVVEVRAANVPVGAQPFALVVSGAIE